MAISTRIASLMAATLISHGTDARAHCTILLERVQSRLVPLVFIYIAIILNHPASYDLLASLALFPVR